MVRAGRTPSDRSALGWEPCLLQGHSWLGSKGERSLSVSFSRFLSPHPQWIHKEENASLFLRYQIPLPPSPLHLYPSADGDLGKIKQYSMFEFQFLFVQFCFNVSVVPISYRSLMIFLPRILFRTTRCFSAQMQYRRIKQKSARA